MRTVGRKVVTTAGYPERLSDTGGPVDEVIITALSTNTDLVYLGNVDTTSAVDGQENGIPLEAGEKIKIEDVDLHEVWIDAKVSGEGITWW